MTIDKLVKNYEAKQPDQEKNYLSKVKAYLNKDVKEVGQDIKNYPS